MMSSENNDIEFEKKYPFLVRFTSDLKKMERPLLGREHEMDMLLSAMARPELCNAILLAEAGSGKTALVQGTMLKDTSRQYKEVDLSKMMNDLNDKNEMANRLKELFNDVEKYRKDTNKDVVLFIDEFHQIVQFSPAAVEVLKPLLADSGTRGIRVIAATTYVEFQEYIAPNLPLVERLQRINIPEPDKQTVMSILRSTAERYGVINLFKDESMFENIYEYTNRYIPANAQPRKSILILDTMIGWYRYSSRPIDMKMLADVIYETEGINIAFRVDASKIKEELDKAVLAQTYATTVIQDRMHICCADLNNKDRPMGSFLFTGSTGVGKTECAKQLAKLLFENDKSLIRMDMTEYALPESLERFRQELTTNVWTKPYCILLLDEIEKACAPVTRLLLQVLDDGRLIDRHNREVTFKNTYIIITTNAGSEIYKTISQYNVDNKGSGKFVKDYDKLIRKSISETTGNNRFPAELLGRIDAIVPFQPLSEQVQKAICANKLKKLEYEVNKKHHVRINWQKDRVINYVVCENASTDSDSGGARNVSSIVEKEITAEIAKYINNHPECRNGKSLYVSIEGQMACENKGIRESDAHVAVAELSLKNNMNTPGVMRGPAGVRNTNGRM